MSAFKYPGGRSIPTPPDLLDRMVGDAVHILYAVGLIDESWLPMLPEPLAERLRMLLEDPEG